MGEVLRLMTANDDLNLQGGTPVNQTPEDKGLQREKREREQVLKHLTSTIKEPFASSKFDDASKAIANYRARIALYTKQPKSHREVKKLERLVDGASAFSDQLTRLDGRAAKWLALELGVGPISGKERVHLGRSHIKKLVSKIVNVIETAEVARDTVQRKRAPLERRCLCLLLVQLDEIWTDVKGQEGLHGDKKARKVFKAFAQRLCDIANKKVFPNQTFRRALSDARSKRDPQLDLSASGDGAG
jgi:hypothetical protein